MTKNNRHQDIYISHWGLGLPDQIIDNDQITKQNQLNMRSTTIEKMVGIKQRRWVSEGQAASDLAVAALRDANIHQGDGSLWVSSISSDYWTPSTSSIVKKKMGWTDQNPAFDVNAACSGLIFSIEAAAARMNYNAEESALVVATEVRSRFLNPKDRASVYVFGDGAGALRLSKNKNESIAEVMWSKCISIPSDSIDISVPAGGSQTSITKDVLEQNLHTIRIHDGIKIEEKILNQFHDLLIQTIKSQGLDLSKYNFFVFHQANQVLLKKLMTKLSINPDLFYSTFEKYGNTSSSSLAINLIESYRLGKIKKGDKVLCLSIGAGDHIGFMELLILKDPIEKGSQ